MATVAPINHMTEIERAPSRRPRVVLMDVLGTMLRVDALAARFVDVGRPEEEWKVFYARTLRDGMALTLAGGATPPFIDVARTALRTTVRHTLSEQALDHVLAGFRELPPYPDVEPALVALTRARIPVYALTHGDPDAARAALDRAGLRTYLREVLASQDIGAFKPRARVYHWACREAGSPPELTALVAAHSWDVHGAIRAGLIGGFATRLEGAVPETIDRPHVSATQLDDVAAGLLALSV
mgnify:CR=1 FL=1